jgi:hypothetical protein
MNASMLSDGSNNALRVWSAYNKSRPHTNNEYCVQLFMRKNHFVFMLASVKIYHIHVNENRSTNKVLLTIKVIVTSQSYLTGLGRRLFEILRCSLV